MQNFYGSNSGEDDRGRKMARDFEERLRQGYQTYIDLLSVEEIFQYYLSELNLLKAAKLIRYAQLIHAESAELLRKEAWLEMELRQHEAALLCIEQALNLDPMDPEIIFLKTEILARLDRYDEAIELLRSMLSITLSPKEVLLQMGNVAQMCGKESQSEQYYREALNHAPDFEEAVYELAFLLESLDKEEEAIHVYEDFLEKRPYAPHVWYELGRLYVQSELLEKALEAYDYAIIVQETIDKSAYFRAIYQKGIILLDMGQAREAMACFLKANDCQPNDMHNLFYMGRAYQAEGLLKDAIRYFQRVVKLDADYMEAWAEIGACLERCEKFLEAVYYYQKAYRLEEENEKLAFRIACCEYKLGNLFSAQEHLCQALELQADAICIWKEWAALLTADGRPGAALAFLEKGLESHPKNPEWYYLFAGYAFLNRQQALGINKLRNALLMDVDQVHLFFDIVPDLEQDVLIQGLIAQYTH